MIHKNANLASSMTNQNFGKERNEQIEMVSKITDQNVRNVFNALEKHKLMMDEKFNRMEIDNERLRGQLSELQTDLTINNVVGGSKTGKQTFGSGRNSLALATTTPGGNNALAYHNNTQVSELVLRAEHLDKQIRGLTEKTLTMDNQMQHYGEAIEEIAKQVESANKFTANRLYNQDLKISQSNGIGGAGLQAPVSISMESPALSKLQTAGRPELNKIQNDLQVIVRELSNDKQDLMRETSVDRTYIKMKIDALAWHGRLLNLLKNSQVLDALTLFKNSVLPNDKPQVRNAYIKMMDHGSNAMVQLTAIIKAESLQEKMTIGGPNQKNGDGRQSGMNLEQEDLATQNAQVQRRLYQLLSIAEPILLNDENVIKAINSHFIDLLSDMLLFQNSNLNNI